MSPEITVDEDEKRAILAAFDLDPDEPIPGVSDGETWSGGGEPLQVDTPIDGSPLATVQQATREDYERVIRQAEQAFQVWREVPAPERGDVVRDFGNRLRRDKEALGKLVALENGKILEEGKGEVQEMIDIADFAVGLSRQLYGKTMVSERPNHRMYEQWQPLGIVGIISAFNFPVAVWSWNSFIAAVCGDTMVWKPSSSTPLTAIALQKMAEEVLAAHDLPPGIMTLTIGRGSEVGTWMTEDRRVPLVSATGSVPMGYQVGTTVAQRMGQTILELGGNNGTIVAPTADLDVAERAILFGAAGTAGQRCTTIRRLIVHEDVADELVDRLTSAYEQIPVGNPLNPGTLMGPLINEQAVEDMMDALQHAEKQGGTILTGGNRLEELGDRYVEPTIVEAQHDMPVVHEETFAPILYVMRYQGFEDAIAWHNEVPQGLSSSCFTQNLKEAERFLSAAGSDCGIANINMGTSGAEIGGAFGGEKETGGGREAGSDSWKQYMRRQTVTINWGDELPLAQGIDFSVE